jgi:CheY-like chemotaxis protein
MKRFTIFVLDDDKTFCSLLLCLAERDDFIYSIEGYELSLTVFDNMYALDAAVTYIEQNKPDMVLLDYFLGDGGCAASLEILEKIIRCCVGSTNVSLVSGMHPKDIRLKLAKEVITPMGMGIIQKPFSIEGLIKVIRRSIRKKKNVQHS